MASVASHASDDPECVEAEKATGEAGQQQQLAFGSQKWIEQKERELRDTIEQNYGRIRDVERELSQLQLQLKLTAGPRKQALEMLRCKIEAQNERVKSVTARHAAAKQVRCRRRVARARARTGCRVPAPTRTTHRW